MHATIYWKKIFCLCSLLLLISSSLPGQNISLVSQLKPYSGTSYQYGDVWAEGNIACVGVFSPYNSGNGVAFFNITNPAAPVFLHNYYTGNQFEQGVIRSDICYIASWAGSGGGLHILSITNPAAPVLIARIGKTTGTVTNGHDTVHTLFLERNFLYEADHHTPVVKIFNVSNPATPVFLWNLTTTNTVRVHQITVVGNRLYTSGWGDATTTPPTPGKTDIWDVSNVGTQRPVFLGSISSGPNAHSSWPSDDNKLLVVCREIAGGDVGLYDITDPAHPVLKVTINPASMGLEADTPHNPVIKSNLLFLSWYQNGVHIFDITDRSKPMHIGAYDTYSTAETSLFQGNWGVYPHLGLNKILLSDMQKGLIVLDASAVLTGTNNYPPLLIHSPISMTTTAGTSVALSSTFTGALLKYQWFFNGSGIAGATDSSFSIPFTRSDHAGNYFVIATNSVGSVTSSIASLSVVVPPGDLPTIVSQPQSVSVYPQNSATFSVAVTGSGNFGYQWRLNGSDLSSATNNSFTITNVQPAEVGYYSVAVSNAYGIVVSSNAILSLIDSPYINNVRAAPGGRAALISWSTTVPTDAQVQYEAAPSQPQSFSMTSSESASFSQFSSIDRNLSTNHTILLSGLAPDTTYGFEIISTAGTNHYLSAVYQFTTAGNIILDNTNAVFTGTWTTGTISTNNYGPDYQYATTSVGGTTAYAAYTPNIATPGRYNVYTWYPNGSNRSTDTHYFISYSGGVTNVYINQKNNGGIWLPLATNLPFAGGNSGFVRLYNDSAMGGFVVIADAIRFEYIATQDSPQDQTVPKWWETFFFGGSVNAAADPDGDGYTTAKEYTMGTSPVDATSCLQLNIDSTTTNAAITFCPLLSDRTYELLYRPDVAASSWQSLFSGTPSATAYGDGTLSLPTTNSSQGFYRLRVQLNTNSALVARQTLKLSTSFSSFTNDVVCGVANRPFVK
jgi:hypothetical protein